MDYMSNGRPDGVPRHFSSAMGVNPAGASPPPIPSLPSDLQDKKGLAGQWAKKTIDWGMRDYLAEGLNQATSSETRTGQQFRNLWGKTLEKFEISKGSAPSPSAPASASASASLPKGYSEIFRLGQETVPANALSWTQYQETVKNNLREFGSKAKATEGSGGNFKKLSPGGYVRHTLVEKNFHPIRDALQNRPGAEVGTALLRTATFGAMGFDILKQTREAYQAAKAREDGTWRSKLRTWRDTGVAAGKYALRDIASWEAACAGSAIGTAIIPIAVGGVSMGGAAVGVLAGLAASKGLDAVLKTGDRDKKQRRTDADGKEIPDDFLEKGMNPIVG